MWNAKCLRMGLEEYRAKRDFNRTPEPSGGEGVAPGEHLFIVQKHAARRLHYDFRLQLDGVLKSWAVTRGPSLDPGDKRLAVEVEDHPLEYGGFEGVIPTGEYGGGTVLLWDRGQWEPVGDPERGLAEGVLKFRLWGEKLKGGWALIRLRGSDGGRRNWLLVKERDEEARDDGDIVADAPLSVLSRKSIEEIAAAPSDVWSARRATAAQRPGARPGPLPEGLEPQLATLATEAPSGDEWLHEFKFDGYRVLTRIDGRDVRMLTRGGHDWASRFAALREALGRLHCGQALLDGEVVVLDPSGVTDFGSLQQALSEGRDQDLTYFLFDLLYIDGMNLTGVPLEARKELLADLLTSAPPALRYSDHVVGRGPEVRRRACGMAVEGIVSKLRAEPYRPGRNRDWVKSKCSARQEFVIGGFTPPSSGRKGIGALMLGVWDAGKLRYAGKVGTGFTERMLDELYRRLSALARNSPAFVDPPKGPATWTEPQLVAEVEFTEWTKDGHVRHPSFRGLRADKDPSAVVRESHTAGTGKAEADERLQRYPFTHPERILWAGQGVTKRGLAAYYAEVAHLMLPHVGGRPLSLVRCPEGEGKECFFQRHAGNGLDPAIKTVPVPGDEPTLWIDSVEGLFALVQMGVLEIHQWGARVGDVERPDRLCFDLDPDPALAWPLVIEAAFDVRRRLAELGLGASFVKTTGGKGLHVVVPITPDHAWDEVKRFCKAFAERMVRDDPHRYVSTITKARRAGKIFIDYLRNQRAASWIAPFSTRARPDAPLSIPIDWSELDAGIRSDHYTVTTIGRRLAVIEGDPWSGIADSRQGITAEVLAALGL